MYDAVCRVTRSLCQVATLKTNRVWDESKLLRKSINYKEMDRHMKEHIGISSFSQFPKVWMKRHQSTSFQKLRKSHTNERNGCPT